ncbi:MAG: hypothetical protein AAF384_04225 [Pseudomonadota bacterium]
MKTAYLSILTMAWLVAASSAHAFMWDEPSDGDLSGIVGAPTVLGPLALGPNTVGGTAGAGDFDLFTFDVLPGDLVTGIIVDLWAGPTGSSFLAIAPGPVWPTGLGFSVASGPLLGFSLFGAAAIGTDILPATGIPALGAGTYTILVQDTGATHDYGLTFVGSPVPVPAALPLLISALGALGAARLGRQR